MRNLKENDGLSMSQATSISNLCNQKALDINSKLSQINNYSKEIEFNGSTLLETDGVVMPSNVVELLLEKARLHATQAFLIESIKGKEKELISVKQSQPTLEIEVPKPPKYLDYDTLSYVDENWGWSQLTDDNYNEYIEAEAFASHIGQFIHNGSILDRLRKELPTIKKLEWIEIEVGKKTPMILKVHHKPEQLLELHNDLANKHREYESRVNYFKAKVKNSVTMENARISLTNSNEVEKVGNINLELQNEYNSKYNKYLNEKERIYKEFETEKFNKIKSISALRIKVDGRFQPVVDEFLTKE